MPPTATPLPDGAWSWLHDFTRWCGRWLFRLVFRLRVHGRERLPAGGAVVLVANHSAEIDGPLLYGLVGRRCVFLVKDEAFHGLKGWGMRRVGQLPVRRDTAQRAPLLAAVRVLRDGGIVAVFPEGTRGDGDVTSARQGAAWLARTTGAVVVPVACRGTRRPAGRRRWRPAVDVLVGSPVELVCGPGRTGLAAGSEHVRGELAALVAQLDELRAKQDPSTVDGLRRHGE